MEPAKGKESGESFMTRILDMVNASFTTNAISLGYELGLFDGMAKFDVPKTSQEIGDALGFKERYIRLWLENMVIADIVTYDPTNKTFSLPQHRAPFLTTGSPKNLVALSTWNKSVSENYLTIMNCFKKDGPNGLNPFDCKTVQDNFKVFNSVVVTDDLIHRILSQVPGLLSKLEKGITVCDAGCGHGTTAMKIAEKYPNSKIIGFDVNQDQINKNRAEALKRDLANVSFEVQDIHKLPCDWSNMWDFIISIDVIHDLPYPDVALKELRRCLKPEEYYSILDINADSNFETNIGNPFSPLLFCANLFYCTPVSLYFENGKGLGVLWGRQVAEKMLQEAGFSSVNIFAKDGDALFHGLCCK